MFNVVIEKELDINNDPLIIKEDINDIVQSIEEQLYNINVSYRNHVRKIKNNIKSLEGVSESTFVILEDDNVNDDNLIYYLTNVLEISLDCVIATLCESREFKPQLSTVNSLTDLLQIDHPNITVCNQIIENCKELFNVYSEVNDKKLSSTAFYEILDESIARSVKRNEFETVTVEDFQENKIYNLVIENLDTLVGHDLNSTYDNIKLFAANQVQIQEGFWSTIFGRVPGWGALHFGQQFWDIIKRISGLAVVGTVGWGIKEVTQWLYLKTVTLKDFDFVDGRAQAAITPLLKIESNKPVSLEDANKILDYLDVPGKPFFERAYVLKLLKDSDFYKKYAEFKTQAEAVAKTRLNGLEVEKSKLDAQIELLKAETSPEKIAETRSKIDELLAKKETVDSQLKDVDAQLQTTIKDLGIKDSLLQKTSNELNNIETALAEARQFIHDQVATASIATSSIVGLGIITFMVATYFISKRIFLTKNSVDTIKQILALRKKIDALRKSIVVVFPELTVQFNFVDSEVKKCEQESTRKNDVVMAYQCSMKYFMGSYALVMYSTLVQLVKDGGSLNSFNKLSDVHSYKGFATMTTRQLINELNAFYSLMIDYDATMNDAFESIFYLMKKQILENRGSDNIIKQLPNNLALGRV